MKYRKTLNFAYVVRERKRVVNELAAGRHLPS